MKFVLIALLTVGCSSTTVPKKSVKQNLVLIQGSHLDSTVWNEVKKSLNPEVFNVVELGRLGRDTETEASLKIVATLSCQAIPEKSILVGHCLGGAISNQMAGICPEKIKSIIYVSALVPLNGERPFDLMNNTDKRNYSKVVNYRNSKIIPESKPIYFQWTEGALKPGSELPELYPEWQSLGSEEVSYDEAKFNAIPKAYILGERDKLLNLTTQFQYMSRTGIINSDGIQAGHYSMLSNPEKLGALISKWSKAL
jgi:pimeloyl-ACP methyl ester carboxylesterase